MRIQVNKVKLRGWTKIIPVRGRAHGKPRRKKQLRIRSL